MDLEEITSDHLAFTDREGHQDKLLLLFLHLSLKKDRW